MIPAAYFALGRMIYGLIERRDGRFVLAEVAAQIIFLALTVQLLQIPSVFLRSVIVGAAFWLTALLVRLAAPQHPVEAGPARSNSKRLMVPIGIIDFCWTGIMAATLSFILFAKDSSPFADPLPVAGMSQQYT